MWDLHFIAIASGEATVNRHSQSTDKARIHVIKAPLLLFVSAMYEWNWLIPHDFSSHVSLLIGTRKSQPKKQKAVKVLADSTRLDTINLFFVYNCNTVHKWLGAIRYTYSSRHSVSANTSRYHVHDDRDSSLPIWWCLYTQVQCTLWKRD